MHFFPLILSNDCVMNSLLQSIDLFLGNVWKQQTHKSYKISPERTQTKQTENKQIKTQHKISQNRTRCVFGLRRIVKEKEEERKLKSALNWSDSRFVNDSFTRGKAK